MIEVTADKADPLIGDRPTQAPQPELSPQDILKTFHRNKNRGQAFALEHRRRATVNEQYVNGNQFIGPNLVSQTSFIKSEWFSNVPKKAKPILHNIALTYASILTKDRPSVYGVPVGNSINDQAAADATTKYIDFIEQDLEIDDAIYEMVYSGTYAGTSAIKVCYVEEGEHQAGAGNLYLDNLSVHDFYLDPDCQEPNDSSWIIIRKFLTREKADELCEPLDIEPPAAEDWIDGNYQPRHGVPSYEVWQRPNRKYPQGYFAHILADHVIELIPQYPFSFSNPRTGKIDHELPCVFFTPRKSRGSPYGQTWVSDCVPLQAAINSVLSKLYKLWLDTSAAQRLIPSQLKDGAINENLNLFFTDPVQASAIRYIDPPPVPPIYADLLQRLEAAMFDVSGVNEATTGQEQYASQSAIAKQYQAQLDALKTADSIKSLDRAVLNLYRLILRATQKFKTQTELLSIFDDENMTAEAKAFSGADIQGVDVRLQMRSGRDLLQASKEADALQRMQMGTLSPTKADTLVGSIGSKLAQDLANHLIDEYLKTGAVNIEPQDIEAETMLAQIQARQTDAVLSRDSATVEKLEQLKTQFAQAAIQAQQTAAGPAAAQPNIPGKPGAPPELPAALPSPIKTQPQARPGNRNRHAA